jgi:hypothetical protein
MPLVKCPDCGNDISPSAPSCPHCGRPQSAAAAPKQKVSHEGLQGFGALVIIGAIVWGIYAATKNDDHASSSSAPYSASVSGESEPPTAVPVTVQLPSDEAALVRIISDSQRETEASENDMQKGGVKHRRDKDICSLMQDLSVDNWVGTLKKIDANSDGKGVLEISLAKDVEVTTWNNDFSDRSDHTLIEPGSPLFQTASSMKKGQTVTFAGRFFSGGEGDCLKEGSVTLSGKLSEPEFIFRFSSISSYTSSTAAVDVNGNVRHSETDRKPNLVNSVQDAVPLRRTSHSARTVASVTPSTTPLAAGDGQLGPKQDENTPNVDSNSQLASWEAQIQARIQRAWLKPPSARTGIDCIVYVTQVPGGEVVNVRLGGCNGDAAVRESIQGAVFRASPLPPPPDPELFERNLEIQFKPVD